MDNHKLIQILNTFSNKEWREFSKFVASPYFNTDKHCIRLLEILKKEFAKKDGFQLSRTRLEKLFSKNNPADASLLNVKLSLLTRLAEQFFAHQKLKSDNLLSNHLLLEDLFDRGLRSHFEKIYRKTTQNDFLKIKEGGNFYLRKYMLEDDFFRYIIACDKKTYVSNENLQNVSDTLDVMYLIIKTELHYSMKMSERVFGSNYDFASFKFLDDLLKVPRLSEYPVIQIYHAAYQLNQPQSNIKHFDHLLELLETYASIMDSSPQRILYILLGNYCVTKLSEGFSEYLDKMYCVYRQMEETGLLIEGKWADIRTLQNLIIIALKVNEFERADHIIEKYKDKVEPTIRMCTYNYFRAIYNFSIKDYDSTLHYLSRVHTIDYEFNMNIKLYTLQSYYEKDTEYSHHTEQVLRSFKAFFRQSKMFANDIKESYINFASVVNSLYRIKHREGKETIGDVLKKIEQYDFLTNRGWLLEKIEELQNKPRRRVQY